MANNYKYITLSYNDNANRGYVKLADDADLKAAYVDVLKKRVPGQYIEDSTHDLEWLRDSSGGKTVEETYGLSVGRHHFLYLQEVEQTEGILYYYAYRVKVDVSETNTTVHSRDGISTSSSPELTIALLMNHPNLLHSTRKQNAWYYSA